MTYAGKIRQVSEDHPELSYNHFHNILRLFNVLTNFPFTASETILD